MHTTSGYIPIRGSRIFFETTGEGEPVLLLHGGLGTIDDFASQRPTLAGCFKVVAFERPGHGHTADIAEPFSFAAMLGYTIDFIEASTLGPVNLVGWSDGAILSLLLAISRPDLLKRMVCVSGNFDTSFYTAGTLERFRSATLESFGRDQAKLLRRYDDISPDGPVHFSVVLEKTITMWSREPNITREELAKIKAPTLVMSGDSDVIPLDHTVTLFRSIKGAELCVIPGATHFLLSERPEATTRAILDFLMDEES
jgi:pimeloyl-ACP methyl ester carboxylesterase